MQVYIFLTQRHPDAALSAWSLIEALEKMSLIFSRNGLAIIGDADSQ